MLVITSYSIHYTKLYDAAFEILEEREREAAVLEKLADRLRRHELWPKLHDDSRAEPAAEDGNVSERLRRRALEFFERQAVQGRKVEPVGAAMSYNFV